MKPWNAMPYDKCDKDLLVAETLLAIKGDAGTLTPKWVELLERVLPGNNQSDWERLVIEGSFRARQALMIYRKRRHRQANRPAD